MPQLTQEQYENPPTGSGCARILAIRATKPTDIITVQEDEAHHQGKQRMVAWTRQGTQTLIGLPGGKLKPGESMDEAFLREGDEEALGTGRFVDGMPVRSLKFDVDTTSGVCKILREEQLTDSFKAIGELIGLSPFYLRVPADQSEHRLYIVLLSETGEKLRPDGVPNESLPPVWTPAPNLFTHSRSAPYHFTHRVMCAHGYLYFLEHLLPRLSCRIEDLAGFQGSREEFEAREAATFFLSQCDEKFQR